MNNNFQELTKALAKGLNFEENAVILLVAEDTGDGGYHYIRRIKGDGEKLTALLRDGIERILEELTETQAEHLVAEVVSYMLCYVIDHPKDKESDNVPVSETTIPSAQRPVGRRSGNTKPEDTECQAVSRAGGR